MNESGLAARDKPLQNLNISDTPMKKTSNNNRTTGAIVFALAAIGILGVLTVFGKSEDGADAAKAMENPSSANLIAVLQPTDGNEVSGWVTFTEMDGQVEVVAQVEGLEPDTLHGFHVHQFGDLSSPDGKGAGGHFNPEEVDHALPETKSRHAGDLGNLEADENGKASYRLVVDNLSLTNGDHAILGRGVIVHAEPDDGGQPTGNAGSRIAQGVIGLRNPEAAAE